MSFITRSDGWAMQDLRTLTIFVQVAERRSFVRAAADLGITQSGVSNAINRLEDQLRRIYYPEAERLVADVTGAARVVIFDHTVRRSWSSSAKSVTALRCVSSAKPSRSSDICAATGRTS